MDVAEVLLTIRCRVLRLLGRRGVIETADELELLPSDETERDPVTWRNDLTASHAGYYLGTDPASVAA